jgi:hypothetical protein
MGVGVRHRAVAGVVAGLVVVAAAVAVAVVARHDPSPGAGETVRRNELPGAAAPTEPQDATQAVTLAFEQWLDGSNPAASRAVIEDAAELQPALDEAVKKIPGITSYRGHVNSVHFTSDTTAEVDYSLFVDRVLIRPNLIGTAVLVDGRWLVSRETVCNLLAANGIACPQDSYVPAA